MKIVKLEKEVWREHFSEDAHKICFNEFKPKELDRTDYTLFGVDDEEKPVGYVMVREMDSDTCYWQFGGVFPGTKGTIKSWKSYDACLSWTRERYKRVTMYIENTNKVMLKFAMNSGFLITGIRNFNGNILIEHLLEFKNGDPELV